MRSLLILGVALLLSVTAYGAFFSPTPAAATLRQQRATATPAEEPPATSPLTTTEPMTGTDVITGARMMTETGMMTGTEMPTMSVAPTMAMVELQNITGTLVGMAHITETADGLQMSVVISNFQEATPGEHGIHFHQVGRCTPDFAVAGAHFNPTHAKHGLENPAGPHVGDLPNIEIDENGAATYEATTNLVTLGTGENALLIADGSSLIFMPTQTIKSATQQAVAVGVLPVALSQQWKFHLHRPPPRHHQSPATIFSRNYVPPRPNALPNCK